MNQRHGYGVVQIGGFYLGIEISALIEAVQWPEAISPHPTARGVLLGVFTLRGKPVPLVDIRGLFAQGSVEAGPTPLVAVIRHNGGHVGIAVDEVCEIVHVSQDQPCALTSGDRAPGLLSTLLTIQDGKRMIYALDLVYLAGLPDVLLAFEPESGSPGQTLTRQGRLHHYLVFECDGRNFCIDASVVTGLVDKPEITPSDFGNERCLGTTDVRGTKAAVLSLSHVLGFETGKLPAKDQLLLLTAPDGRVSGFGYDRMIAIRRNNPGGLMAVPTYGLREPDLLSAVMSLADGEQALLLAHETLLKRPEVQNYARIFQHEVKCALETHQTARAVHRQACLLFRAPIHFAAPLSQISEILEVPTQLIAVNQPENHLLGQFNLRGEQVPLICLSSLIEASPQSPTPSSRVLVVRGKHSVFGFAVCQVDAIDSFKEFDPTQLERGYSATPGKAQSINDRVRSLVSIGNHQQSWRTTLLDLHNLAVQLEASESTCELIEGYAGT
jgi:purine-binding chemotaxis protein CheW